MRDFTDDLSALRKRVDEAHAYLQIDAQRERLVELEAEASKPGLWDDPNEARRVTTQLSSVQDDVELIERLEGRVDDLETLSQLAREESDDSVAPEIESGIDALRTELDQLELRALFTGEYDERDAICQVAPAGGTQDWTEMLLRMFTRWAEPGVHGRDRRGERRHRSRPQLAISRPRRRATARSPGRKACTVWSASPVHATRAARLRSRPRRRPALDAAELPDIDPNDAHRHVPLGPSRGQHVNVTDSRCGSPSPTVSSCRARTNAQLQPPRRWRPSRRSPSSIAKQRRSKLSGEKRRSAADPHVYLGLYQLVKDERTRYETGNVQAVLDGTSIRSSRRSSSGGDPAPTNRGRSPGSCPGIRALPGYPGSVS
jgi:peptide chain release factor 2